jgi:hypothetical protein
MLTKLVGFHTLIVTTPLWRSVRMTLTLSKWGLGESFGIPENLELNCRGQSTSPWSVFYIVEKVLKRRCQEWPRMSHWDIYNTSYVRKKVKNRLDPNVWRWSATHCWKALKENYKFSSDLIPIESLSKELWVVKVPKVQTGTVSGLLLGSPGKKCHSDVGASE